MTTLNTTSLTEVGTRIPVPSYDQESVIPNIIHLSISNFHRAHKTMYIDALLRSGRDAD